MPPSPPFFSQRNLLNDPLQLQRSMFYLPVDGFLIILFLKFAQFDATFGDINQQGSRQSPSEVLGMFYSGHIVSRGHGTQDLCSLCGDAKCRNI